jgi:hypothetical protein
MYIHFESLAIHSDTQFSSSSFLCSRALIHLYKIFHSFYIHLFISIHPFAQVAVEQRTYPFEIYGVESNFCSSYTMMLHNIQIYKKKKMLSTIPMHSVKNAQLERVSIPQTE